MNMKIAPSYITQADGTPE